MIINNEEVYLIPSQKNKVMVYVPLRGLLFNVDDEVAKKVEARDSAIIELLINEINKVPLINIEDIENKIQKYPPTISINLSDNCMLRCIYCYMCSCINDESKTMTFEEAKSIVDTFVKYAMESLKMKKIKFSFFGGAEPTFDVKLFKGIIEYIKQQAKILGFEYIFGMTTNGCYGEEVMNYIIQNFHKVTYSLDGPDFIQNFHRPMLNGKGSFDIVYKNAKKLYDSGVKFSFRVTVSSETLKHWEKVIDFFASEFSRAELYLAPLLPIGRGADEDLKAVLPNEWEEIAPKIYLYAKDKIKVNFPNVYSPNRLVLNFCGAATANMWIVSKDGTISTCPHDRLNPIHIIGSYDFANSTFNISKEKVKKIREQFSVLSYDQCSDCFCKYTCSGGCPSQRVFGLKSVCDTTRCITQMVFIDYLEKCGLM